jgi:hypothetical protein
MATFLERVTALSGAPSTSSECSTWLTDGAVDVIRRIQRMLPSMLHQCATSTAVTSSGLALTGSDIVVGANRGSFPCREISADDRYKALLSTSLFYATARNPVFYRLNGTLYIAPAPGATSSAANVVTPPTVAYGDSTVAKLPPEMVYLITVYASIQNVVSKMSDVTFPADLTLPTVPTLSTDYTTLVIPTAPTAASLTAISIALPTAPTYTKPTISADVASAVTLVNSHLDTDEDPELANIKVSEVQVLLERWKTDIQDELNEFNKDNEIFKTTIQKLIEEARLKTQEESSQAELLLRRYSEQVAAYTAEVNANANGDTMAVNKYRYNCESVISDYANRVQKCNAQIASLKLQYEALEGQYEKGFAIYAPPTAARRTA